ncbi:MAG TPA: ABC transporter permease [Candidatus Binataceae bacterium]|nr:ABC transporter permease [Candidatus Binataceae bacterium]
MKLGALAAPLAAIILAGLLVTLVLIALGAAPAMVLAALADGAFGNRLACVDTLVKATPLLYCALAVAIAFEGALWNIGADGQLIVGALAAGACGPRLGGWPHPAAILVMLLAGALGGALWGAFAGWLRARRDVNEVISTIMLNFTAAQLLSWAVHGPLMEASGAFPESAPIAASAELHHFLPPSRLNLGMLLAVLLAVACYVFLFHTAMGFELRALGRNRRAAAWFGISAKRLTIMTLTLSGALAGLGGAVHVAAVTDRLYESLSPGWGYEAIAVALVAQLNPLAIIPSAIFFGALDNGAQSMQRTAGVSPVLVQVIQALVIILLLAFDRLGLGRQDYDAGSASRGPEGESCGEILNV